MEEFLFVAAIGVLIGLVAVFAPVLFLAGAFAVLMHLHQKKKNDR